MSNILALLNELKEASKYEGYHLALYNHADAATFHTVQKRQEYLNHKHIAEKVLAEIRHLIDTAPPPAQDGGDKGEK